MLMKDKYLKGKTMDEWVRLEPKIFSNVSNFWAILVIDFPLLAKCLAWTIGHGKNLKLGLDPWIGGSNLYILSDVLIHDPSIKGLSTFDQVFISNFNANVI